MEKMSIMNQNKLQCGIVILNYNDYETTSYLLEMIQNYHCLKHIAVVDNHSTDGSYEKLQKYQNEKIKIIRAAENGGYSKGNNIGIRYLLKHTKDDIICIANSDVEFDETFVERILWQFEKRPSYAVITGLQVTPQGEIAAHPFWEEYTAAGWIYAKLAELRIYAGSVKHKKTVSYAADKLSSGRKFFRTGTVEGSLFFIRKDDFVKAGLFDEGVWIYCEEDILSKKLSRAGRKTGVDASVKYIHYGAKTTDKVFGSMTKINHVFRSSVYYFNHYLSDKPLLQGFHLVLCCMIWLKDTGNRYFRKSKREYGYIKKGLSGNVE